MKKVRNNLKAIIEEAIYEVLQEEVLSTSTQRILGKFPTLKDTLVDLMTNEFDSFVDEILWISPKPTTFQIDLNNGQSYYLKWLGSGFQAEIAGKRYMLTSIDEYQQALDAIGDLLKYTPPEVDDLDGEEEFGPDGGFGEEPGAAGGAGDFGEEEFGAEEPSPDETEFS